ncbi:MAG: hypothetical protein OD918_11570 [Gammaproteobacteria bacterium]
MSPEPSTHGTITRRYDGRALLPMRVKKPVYKSQSPRQRGAQPDRTLASQNQWFTKREVAMHCIQTAQDVMRAAGKNWSDYRIVEPSAGDGKFYFLLPPKQRIGIDLLPQINGVVRHDFLTWSPKTPGKYAVIGNPPFGVRGDLARAFIARSGMFADICAFILPIGFMDEQRAYFPGYALIHSEELRGDSFVNILGHESKLAGQGALNTCFNVWSASSAPRPPVYEYVCAENVRVAACNFPQPAAPFIAAHDVFIKARYYGQPKVSVCFDDVKSRRSHYVVGIGIGASRDKKNITAKIMQLDWRRYHTKAMNGSFSITLGKTRQALHDIGLASKVAKGETENGSLL